MHASISDVHGPIKSPPLPQVRKRRDEAVPFVGRSRKHLVAHRQAVHGHHQGKQHLRLTRLAVLAEAVLLEFVLRERFEVERRTIEKQYGFRQQRPGRVADASSQSLDQAPVEPIHHPVHLLQRQADPEILLEPPDAAALAVGVGDARHHDMEQDAMGSWVPMSRQQIVEAELPVHRTVNLMDAGDHPLFLFE